MSYSPLDQLLADFFTARFMAPLADSLRLKMNVDVEPSKAEEKALLLIDQVCFGARCEI